MKSIFLPILASLFLFSCAGDENETENIIANPEANKVMLLKVDYITNTFEGGKELSFATETETFSVTNEYESPADFGRIQLFYEELNVKIFDGTIHWMGLGAMSYPEEFLPANAFQVVATDDFAGCFGFENVFNPQGQDYDYLPVWSSIQGLVKVRQYLQENPAATVKLFLYTPSVGFGNPEEWDWIVILKN